MVGIQTQSIVQLTAAGTGLIYSFARRVIFGIRGFLPNGLAVSPTGTIYTDTSAGTAIKPHRRPALLWKR